MNYKSPLYFLVMEELVNIIKPVSSDLINTLPVLPLHMYLDIDSNWHAIILCYLS